MKRPPPQTVAALVVVAVLAAVAILTSRRAASTANSYASTDYRAGGYRAWATLLAREGIKTGRFVLRPIELDGRTDTLISAQPVLSATDPSARTAADIAALAGWVRGGGRLVYLGRNAALGDPETALLGLPFLVPDVGARGPLTGSLAADVQALHELGSSRMLLVEHRGAVELADTNGDIVVRYPLGHGELVVLADPVPFTNANIANADNARLAYLVGLPRRAGGLVAFDDGLHGALFDRPWYRALPIPVRVGLALLGLALLLGGIGSALRSGPPLRLEPPREPTSAEFVAALAALYERTAARAAARSVLVHAALAVADRSGSGPNEPREALARMLEAPVLTDADLLASAKLAYHVRKDGSHGGNGDGRRAAFAGRTRTRYRR